MIRYLIFEFECTILFYFKESKKEVSFSMNVFEKDKIIKYFNCIYY